MLRVEVKAKQGRWWPNCRGIYGENVVLVFVDFENKGKKERPDFYILTVKDWVDFLTKGGEEGRSSKDPASKNYWIMDERNVPIWPNQPYRGIGVKPQQIQSHQEQWDKITALLGK